MDARIDALRARMDALRALSPNAREPAPQSPRIERNGPTAHLKPFAKDSSRSPPHAPVIADEDAHASVEEALERLEAMAATTPAIRGVLGLIQRGEDGRVTVESFARAAEALREISVAVSGASPRQEEWTRGRGAMSPNGGGSSLGSSPRIVSPGGLRRSASPIGPARRVRVDADGGDARGATAAAAAATTTTSRDAARDDDEAAIRLREWSEHVRASAKATEARDASTRIREDMIEQYRAFLHAGTPPSDPFIAALAEQALNSIREKEEMARGVQRARTMIEALSESDKAKTLSIERLCEEIERMGGVVPDGIEGVGIQWAPGAFDERGLGDEPI